MSYVIAPRRLVCYRPRHHAGQPWFLEVLYTQLVNLTGTPAMSVPLHWTADDLPLSVQFVARFGCRDLLLQLARQLETAAPWFDRLPPLAREAAAPA